MPLAYENGARGQMGVSIRGSKVMRDSHLRLGRVDLELIGGLASEELLDTATLGLLHEKGLVRLEQPRAGRAVHHLNSRRCRHDS